MSQNLSLSVPPQMLDILGQALVIAAKHGDPGQTGTFVQSWAWLSGETQRAQAAAKEQASAQAEAAVQRRIDEAVKAKLNESQDDQPSSDQ